MVIELDVPFDLNNQQIPGSDMGLADYILQNPRQAHIISNHDEELK